MAENVPHKRDGRGGIENSAKQRDGHDTRHDWMAHGRADQRTSPAGAQHTAGDHHQHAWLRLVYFEPLSRGLTLLQPRIATQRIAHLSRILRPRSHRRHALLLDSVPVMPVVPLAASRWLKTAVIASLFALVTVMDLICDLAFHAAHPAPLLLAAVVVATLIAGVGAGMISAFLALLYAFGYALMQHEGVQQVLARSVVLAVAAPATMFAVGMLRRSIERDMRQCTRLVQLNLQLLSRERALRETVQHVDAFLSVLGNELNIPVTMLDDLLELARVLLAEDLEHPARNGGRQLLGGRDVVHLLALLHCVDEQVCRLAQVADDVADTALVGTGQLELTLARCELGELVREVAAQQRLVWPGRVLRIAAPTSSLQVLADRDRIGQVLTVFITNALFRAPSDRPVMVHVVADTTQVCVAVCDEGPGLSLEAQQHLWERFHQAADAHAGSVAGGYKRSSASLGVGLYISRAIIERHAGQVGVESAPGNGATFWFSLPRWMAPSPPVDASRDPSCDRDERR